MPKDPIELPYSHRQENPLAETAGSSFLRFFIEEPTPPSYWCCGRGFHLMLLCSLLQTRTHSYILTSLHVHRTLANFPIPEYIVLRKTRKTIYHMIIFTLLIFYILTLTFEKQNDGLRNMRIFQGICHIYTATFSLQLQSHSHEIYLFVINNFALLSCFL